MIVVDESEILNENLNVIMGKVVSFSSKPSKSINWRRLESFFTRIDLNSFDSETWGNIKEIHIIGSKNVDSEYAIDESLWGEYTNGKGCLICLYDYQTDSIPWIDKITDRVDSIDIRFVAIREIDLSKCRKLHKLWLRSDIYLSLVKGLESLSELYHIDIAHTAIKEFPPMSCFTKLTSCGVRLNELGQLVFDVKLNCLKYLSVSNISIADEQLWQNCPKLQKLTLGGAQLVDLKGIGKLSNLDVLHLRNTQQILNLQEVAQLMNLTSLNLSNSDISSVENIAFPPSLRVLVLDGTKVTSITPGITALRQLRRLGLNDMHLKSLPVEILGLCLDFKLESNGYGICLANTEIDDMDSSILLQPRNIVEYWFLHRSDKNEPYKDALNEAKVIFLGDGGAGKSLSINRLLNNCENPTEFDGESTPGISITNKLYSVDNKGILVHYWDFGGQEIMHSMHRMFLTSRTLYVVFINARHNTQDERARYWLHNIKNFANNCPVILVINQIDQNPSASVNEPALRTLYPELKDIVKLSATCYSKEEFEVSLQRTIIKEIMNLSIINDSFLPSWKSLKKRLQSMKEYYIDREEFLDVCKECGVENNPILVSQLLDWFNDLGISFCYRDVTNLSNYMILRPDWMTNAVYAILFNCGPLSKNGIIKHEDIYSMLGDFRKGKRVITSVSYSVREVEYILGVIRKFRLAYRIDDEREFVPMLCDRNENVVSQEFYGKNDILEYHLVYQYLPVNIIHRLMVEFRHDLNSDYVWLTGAVFESKKMGYRALVKMEDNSIRIYVQAQNSLYPANAYLGFIRNTLKEISNSLGLVPGERIIYKEEDRQDEIDYEYIIDSFEHGNTSVYSSVLKRNLNILEILKQAGGEAAQRREKLLQDLVEACQMLQRDKIFWHSKEDERNTFIREILRSKEYFCADQTRSGKSQSGKSAGELDIEVFEEPNKPLAIVEALNISGSNANDIDYWNKHLQKLLDNYNPLGMPVGFLISYLECSKDDFKEIYMDYFTHIKGYSCSSYLLTTAKEYPIEKSFLCRVIESQYDRGGMPTKVYNIIVRIGE